jgi:thiosulfate reductase cytochrome b subunit
MEPAEQSSGRCGPGLDTEMLMLISTPNVKPMAHPSRCLHPLLLRIMHWTNAVAIFIMIGSGWKIYNDDVIFGLLHFPDSIVIGKWAQYGLQWHFFGMWIFVLNGIAFLSYGIATGRFRKKLFPISVREYSQRSATHCGFA